jgi:hypothetical protein
MRVFTNLLVAVALLGLASAIQKSRAQGVVFIEAEETRSTELSYRFSYVSRKGERRVLATVRSGPVVLLECNTKEIVYLDRQGVIWAQSLQGGARQTVANTSLFPASEMIGKTVLRRNERRLFAIEDQHEKNVQKRSFGSFVRVYGFDGSVATLFTLRGRGVALNATSSHQLNALSEQETATFSFVTNQKALVDGNSLRDATRTTSFDGASVLLDADGKSISVRQTGNSGELKRYGTASSFAIVQDFLLNDHRVLFVDMDSRRGEDSLVELDERGRTNVLAKSSSIGAACYVKSGTSAK